MLRLFLFCRYFDKFHGLRGGTLKYYQDIVDKNEFLNYILNIRHFGEDIRETFKRWVHYFTGSWILQGNQKGLYRMQKVRRMVYDLVEDAKRRGYLIEEENYTKTLRMDDRGRAFIKTLKFIEVSAKEYGYIASNLATLIFAIGGMLLIFFWENITNLIAMYV